MKRQLFWRFPKRADGFLRPGVIRRNLAAVQVRPSFGIGVIPSREIVSGWEIKRKRERQIYIDRYSSREAIRSIQDARRARYLGSNFHKLRF